MKQPCTGKAKDQPLLHNNNLIELYYTVNTKILLCSSRSLLRFKTLTYTATQ